jgi:PQQ-dependent dehydrogenase (methanol/ethanol family)
MFKRIILSVALAMCGCAQPSAQAGGVVDQARLLAAEDDPDNWLAHGRTYAEQRYSPLTQIDAGTVGTLGLAFSVPLGSNRGMEGTPLVADGVMYLSTAWSRVMAVRADTGEVLWRYDPKNIGAKGAHACCDVVNRGVALWQGKVFVGTIDGRLIALDAGTGKELWSVVTVDQAKPYTITMAPRVVRGKVIIGNSGAELGVRGYVSAYDAATGKLVWRFYTVPGNMADGPDHAASDEAFARFAGKTWAGNWWEMGGGGTVWDSVVYDAEFDQLLVGVGNGAPWNHRARSAGQGDNLFLASILALDPDTGAYKWHYQLNPGETWDFTATQQMILADLTIDGRERKVVMQAPKNGFFYVIDRATGKPISAGKYAPMSWATGIDMATGRPIEVPGARYANAPFMIYPSGLGAHAWMPMSYSPRTGLVYVPAMHAPLTLADDVNYTRYPGRWNTGTATLPPPKGREREAGMYGWLAAWDPVAQKERWRVRYDFPWNGGTLATAGDLVFQGDARGLFHAYDANDGRELWRFTADQGIMAGPISYRVNGEQYVAVLSGYGGSMGVATEIEWAPRPQPEGRLLVFKLGGSAAIAKTEIAKRPYVTSVERFSQAQLAEGQKWYLQFCRICHAGPTNPDLFRSPALRSAAAWKAIVHDGALKDNGMIAFSPWIDQAQVEAIRAYVLDEAGRRAAAEKP